MSADKPIETLIDSVADGDDIDWAALEAHADPEIRALLAHLKTVAGVADVHRTSTDDEETGPVPSPIAGGAGAPLGELGRWGHLQLVRKVGEGSYGEVFHARDTWLDHPVALKLLRPELTDRVAPTKLLDEARVLVKVRHPNVVTVHGADLQQNRVGFWMEFVQGQRLDDIVAFQGLLSAEEAAEIGQMLCSALTAVHDAGLVHRDVKAQNVIREPKGRVVLMDFGAGQLIADAVGGAGAGTPLYLAPEMFRDAPASVQTDIYALGVLLYYLVTAGYPVPARSLEELKQAHATGRQRPLLVARPGLPRGFVNVVEKMLKVDPAERYQTANEALAGLRRFTAPASLAKSALKWLGFAAVGVAAVTIFGLMNSVAFNVVLGRSNEFDPDRSLGGWFRWGVASTFPVVFYMGVWALLLTLTTGALRLVRKFVAPVDDALSKVRQTVAERLSERGLDDPVFLLQLTTGAGAVGIIVLALSFWDYGAGFVASPIHVTDAASAKLAAFQPVNGPRVDLYGRLIDLFLLIYTIAIFRIVATAKQANVYISRAMKLAAATFPVLALILWNFPYRVMYQNTFERVDLETVRCYRLGESTRQVLLHCPDVAPPRNLIVSPTDTRLRDRGVRENIFMPANLSQPTH
ncbi:MAG TPA: serine/threonine-protein kinase [Vicinamibacterales bacterium]|nr:serine/threonine-protein kinase [Vicinamibacterales bacterium]